MNATTIALVGRRPIPAMVIPTVAAVTCGLSVGWLLNSDPSRLAVVTVACLFVQIGLVAILSRRVLRRGLALGVWVSSAWLVYFTLRLVVTQIDRANLNEHFLVRQAGDDVFIWAWLVTTIGLAAFVLGVALSGPAKRTVRHVPNLGVNTLLGLATMGVVGRYLMVFGHINSGILENLTSLYLFAFAALGYHTATVPSVKRPLYLLVAMASALGIVTTFKEAAVIPIAALAVGIAARGLKIRRRSLVLIAGFGLLAFLTVQGNRVAFDVGDSRPIYSGAVGALFDYDLEAGVRADPDRSLIGGVSDTVQAVSRRFGGVTSIMVVHERVPQDVAFLRGQSLWEPALSSVPVVPIYVDLEFTALSLGRYFSTNFIAVDQDDNTASQAITIVGDLYLNFGNAGVVIGMLVFGLITGGLDRIVGPLTPTHVGGLAYLGQIFISIERNVAYVAVNGAIRVVLLLLLLRAVTRWGRRNATRLNPHTARSTGRK